MNLGPPVQAFSFTSSTPAPSRKSQRMAGDPRPIPLSLWVVAFFVLQVSRAHFEISSMTKIAKSTQPPITSVLLSVDATELVVIHFFTLFCSL